MWKGSWITAVIIASSGIIRKGDGTFNWLTTFMCTRLRICLEYRIEEQEHINTLIIAVLDRLVDPLRHRQLIARQINMLCLTGSFVAQGEHIDASSFDTIGTGIWYTSSQPTLDLLPVAFVD